MMEEYPGVLTVTNQSWPTMRQHSSSVLVQTAPWELFKFPGNGIQGSLLIQTAICAVDTRQSQWQSNANWHMKQHRSRYNCILINRELVMLRRNGDYGNRDFWINPFHCWWYKAKSRGDCSISAMVSRDACSSVTRWLLAYVLEPVCLFRWLPKSYLNCYAAVNRVLRICALSTAYATAPI